MPSPRLDPIRPSTAECPSAGPSHTLRKARCRIEPRYHVPFEQNPELSDLRLTRADRHAEPNQLLWLLPPLSREGGLMPVRRHQRGESRSGWSESSAARRKRRLILPRTAPRTPWRRQALVQLPARPSPATSEGQKVVFSRSGPQPQIPGSSAPTTPCRILLPRSPTPESALYALVEVVLLFLGSVLDRGRQTPADLHASRTLTFPPARSKAPE